MTRIEENNVLFETIKKSATAKTSGTYGEIAALHSEVISVTLMDISKSLAILADKAGSETKE